MSLRCAVSGSRVTAAARHRSRGQSSATNDHISNYSPPATGRPQTRTHNTSASYPYTFLPMNHSVLALLLRRLLYQKHNALELVKQNTQSSPGGDSERLSVALHCRGLQYPALGAWF
ncbi:hypothetical protein NDU88_001371 [Pleurodeles waltl]|uniref:Uncharacterized protein n=1 Tax=Pleurodeles waltl TaxID=8319 RepID=A0AAV7Q444_PLEWA|nr:hypothetical protein NDU88_001371 [Pleurodeles waltl]